MNHYRHIQEFKWEDQEKRDQRVDVVRRGHGFSSSVSETD